MKFIMGEPEELRTFQEYISLSEKSITLTDLVKQSFPVPARLSEVYYSHCTLIPQSDEAA